ncbi:hypothetical protein DMH15_29615, partial [Streptomyces sp. WAC 06725]
MFTKVFGLAAVGVLASATAQPSQASSPNNQPARTTAEAPAYFVMTDHTREQFVIKLTKLVERVDQCGGGFVLLEVRRRVDHLGPLRCGALCSFNEPRATTSRLLTAAHRLGPWGLMGVTGEAGVASYGAAQGCPVREPPVVDGPSSGADAEGGAEWR